MTLPLFATALVACSYVAIKQGRDESPTKRITELDERRIHALTNYNSEVGRGIAHSAGWQEHMRAEQEWFDAKYQSAQ